MLSNEENIYYSRHLLLQEIGEQGQLKLKEASVLIVGAGGLGCPVLSYLTGAGVGHIGILDADLVEKTNLHRQFLFGISKIGQPKTEAVINHLQDLNPYISFTEHFLRLRPKNAIDIIKNYEIVIDATDNFPTRYLINDACVILDKPFVSGSIDRFQGQISVFNYVDYAGTKGPTYRCLFPVPPSPETAPDCSQNGVLGVLPGIIGNLQASEVIKMITGAGSVLNGKVLVVDTLRSSFYSFALKRNENAVEQAMKLKGNIINFDYDDFCQSTLSYNIKQISSQELSKKLISQDTIQLIDIRENGRLDYIEGSINIPRSGLDKNISRIKRDIPVVIYCDLGTNSLITTKFLTDLGFDNVYNLTGGIEAWKNLNEKKSE
ncbi:MAG: HesA/MoeB/ThiF family protein [Bacteroidetes bacterium]|nr:HesA/MoeB/ThiF family protein [Bacteroidota bacterium]